MLLLCRRFRDPGSLGARHCPIEDANCYTSGLHIGRQRPWSETPVPHRSLQSQLMLLSRLLTLVDLHPAGVGPGLLAGWQAFHNCDLNSWVQRRVQDGVKDERAGVGTESRLAKGASGGAVMRDHDATTQADGRNFISFGRIQPCSQPTTWRGRPADELSASCQLSMILRCVYGAAGVSWRVREKGVFCCVNSRCPEHCSWKTSRCFACNDMACSCSAWQSSPSRIAGGGELISCPVKQADGDLMMYVHVESCHRPVRHL